jgi:catechol 2,3-dioxygenase-like lactoylglutathione lyase family enzyme
VRPPFIDHITVKVRDLAASRAFYEASLAPFGVRVVDYGEIGIGIGPEGSEDLGLGEGEPRAPIHIAFLANDPATVDAFHAAALEAGGTDNGGPGPGRSTTSATTRPTFSIPTATTSRRCVTRGLPARRSSGRGSRARRNVNGSGSGSGCTNVTRRQGEAPPSDIEGL